MWINSLTSRDACANDPDQNHNLFTSAGHISWAREIHASNFTSQILFLSFLLRKHRSQISFIHEMASSLVLQCHSKFPSCQLTYSSLKHWMLLSWSGNDQSSPLITDELTQRSSAFWALMQSACRRMNVLQGKFSASWNENANHYG